MLNIDMTMARALRIVTEAHPRQEVFVCGDVRMTNRQVLSEVESTVRSLHARSVGKGDRVVALLPAGSEFARLFFATAWLGAVFVPLSPDLQEHSLGSIVEDCEPRLVLRPGELELVGTGPLPSDEGEPGNLVALLYTSGTTGKPKATMHTHRSLIAPLLATLKVRAAWTRPSSLRVAAEAVRALSRYGTRLLRAMGKPMTIMSTTGWHTMTGFHVMLQGLLMGDRLVVLPRFHPEDALEIVQRERVAVERGLHGDLRPHLPGTHDQDALDVVGFHRSLLG